MNTVWMWAALLACAISNWMPEITGIDDGRGRARRPHAGPDAPRTVQHPGPRHPHQQGLHPATTTRRRPAQRGPAPAAGPADHPRRINHTFPDPCPQPSPGPETAHRRDSRVTPVPRPGTNPKTRLQHEPRQESAAKSTPNHGSGQSGMTRPHAGERLRFPHQRMHKVTGSTRRPGGGGHCVHGGFLRPWIGGAGG